MTLTTSIFVKGCRDQLHWLCYCLQFLEKNWAEWKQSDVVVLLDPDCEEIVKDWGVFANYVYEDYWPDRYMHALYSKAIADQYCKGDIILLVDSDTMLTRAASLADFMKGDRLFLSYLLWGREFDAGRKVALNLWPRVVKESTGLDLPVDYMVGRPWLFWRSTFAGARSLVEKHRDMPFKEAVYSEVPFDWTHYPEHPFTFCDLETLGLYAALCEPNKYQMVNFEDHLVPEPFEDLWSHTPFSNELRSRLDQLLRS